MVGVKASGVIVKQKNFGEGDRIVSVLTDTHGEVDFIAKGSRKTSSRKGRSIDLLNNIGFELSRSKGLPILVDVSLINSYSNLKGDLAKLSLIYYLLELINTISFDVKESIRVYKSFVSLLNKFETETNLTILVLLLKAYELYLHRVLGFGVNIDQFFVDVSLSSNEKELLRVISNNDFSNLNKLEYNLQEIKKISDLIQDYSEEVFEKKFKKVNLMI